MVDGCFNKTLDFDMGDCCLFPVSYQWSAFHRQPVSNSSQEVILSTVKTEVPQP